MNLNLQSLIMKVEVHFGFGRFDISICFRMRRNKKRWLHDRNGNKCVSIEAKKDCVLLDAGSAFGFDCIDSIVRERTKLKRTNVDINEK